MCATEGLSDNAGVLQTTSEVPEEEAKLLVSFSDD